MLYTAYQYPGPAAIRYPRGTGPGAIIFDAMTEMHIGEALEVRSGKDIAILSFGALLSQAITAADQLNATVVDMRWVKPLDEKMVLAIVERHTMIVTLEENAIAGGAGAGVNEFLAAQGLSPALLNLGLPDVFIEHGNQADQLAWTGLDSDGIVQNVQRARPTGKAPLLSALSSREPIELPR